MTMERKNTCLPLIEDLPVATWSLKNWKVADYEALLAKIVSGEVKVSNELVLAPESTANVTVNAVQ